MAERKSVSMQDLADKLGISKVTVSKALNGKDGVGEELKEKIFALARESGYVLPELRKTEEQKCSGYFMISPQFSSGDEGKYQRKECKDRYVLCRRCDGGRWPASFADM